MSEVFDTSLFSNFAESQLRSLSEDKRYAYVTYGDLKSISEYRDNTVMAVRAPPETKLQVCLKISVIIPPIETFL